PHVSGAKKLRMQRAAMQRDAHHRKTGSVKAPSIFVKRLRCRRNLPGGADQPCGNALERVVGRSRRYGTFVNPRRQDALAFAQSRRASLGRERDGFIANGVLGHGAPSGSADLLLLAAPHSRSAAPTSASRSRRESPELSVTDRNKRTPPE